MTTQRNDDEHLPREPRFRCALQVVLRKHPEDVELLTADVSGGGAFVRTVEAPPPRALVRLEFALPSGNSTISVSGSVVHVIDPARSLAHYPGFGVRLIWNDFAAQTEWESFVTSLAEAFPEAGRETVMFARQTYVERFRKNAHVALDVSYEPRTTTELDRFLRDEVSRGTVFLPTTQRVVMGAPVNILVVNPATAEIFPLEGIVRRRDSGARVGLTIELSNLTSRVLDGLKEFVESVLVIDEYDVDLFAAAVVRVRP